MDFIGSAITHEHSFSSDYDALLEKYPQNIVHDWLAALDWLLNRNAVPHGSQEIPGHPNHFLIKTPRTGQLPPLRVLYRFDAAAMQVYLKSIGEEPSEEDALVEEETLSE